MSDKFSQLLPMLGAIVAFLFAALLLVYIVRLVFGRRIRAPGARNRPRRLDIVDVFDLDKERQLVIVRRDNTEHLLLIGGPNDVLVESAINRVEGLAARSEPGRTEPSRPATSANWPAGPVSDDEPATVPIKPTVPTGINLPPEMIAAKPPAPKPPAPPRPAAPTTSEEPAAPPPPSAAAAATTPPPAPLRSAPGAPPPPRAAAGQRPAPPPFLARAQQIIKPRADEDAAPAASEPKAAPPPPPPPRPVAPPPLRPAPPPPLRPTAPATGDAPSAPGEPPRGSGAAPQFRPVVPPQRPAPPPPPPPPAPPSQPAPARGQGEDALESLEEEMARLLGRPEKE